MNTIEALKEKRDKFVEMCTLDKIEEFNFYELESLQDELHEIMIDIINLREGYDENDYSEIPATLDELYLDIDSCLNNVFDGIRDWSQEENYEI